MTKSRFFILCSLIFLSANFAWCSFLADHYFFNIRPYLIYIAVIVLLLFCLSFLSRYFFLGALVGLAILRGFFLWEPYFQNQNFVFDKKYEFSGVIVDVERSLDGQYLVLQPENLDGFRGRLSAKAGLFPEYKIGSRADFTCNIRQPQPIESEDGEFAYDKYLAMDRIFGICSFPAIHIFDLRPCLSAKVRKYMYQSLDSALVEPASSISKALILGYKRQLPVEVRENFSKVGLSHILAISGLHVAIIIGLLHLLLRNIGLGRRSALLILTLAMLAYLSLIDWIPSAARASLMAWLLLFGPFIGRKTVAVFSLLLAADIFVLLNPLRLGYDLGFQLSFLAVLGILLYSKYLSKIFSFITNRLKFREVISVTLSAQIFTWPLIVHSFGIFSLIAPIANLVILPLVPLWLVLTLVLSFIGHIPLAPLVAWPLEVTIYFANKLVDILGQIPGAFFDVQHFSAMAASISLLASLIFTFILKPYEKN